MLFLFTVAVAHFLVATTALSISNTNSLSKRDTDCAGIASGSTYTVDGTTFVVEADALRTNNNLGNPLFGGSFIDCMTSCATTTGCTDVSYTSGGTCYLKQGAVGGITGTESGTCDAKVLPPSSPSSSSVPTSTCAAVTVTASAPAAASTTAAASSTGPSCSQTTNAVVNGDFENQCCGYLAPWIVLPGGTTNNIVLKGPGADGGISPPGANDGSYVLDVSQTVENTVSYFVQGISVCPGTTYRLSMAARRNSAASTALAIYISAVVDIGTKGYQMVMFSKNVQSSAWTTFTGDEDIVIPATELTSTYGVLQIQVSNVAQANTGTKDIWIDSIALTPVA